MKNFTVIYSRPVPFHATRIEVSAVDAADAANIAMTQFPDCEVKQVTLASYYEQDARNEIPEQST